MKTFVVDMRGNKTTLSDIEVAYHRNGVGGAPFHLIKFTRLEKGPDYPKESPLIAVVFEDEGSVAVIDSKDDNSKWRGDYFEQPLRDIIKEYQKEQDAKLDLMLYGKKENTNG